MLLLLFQSLQSEFIHLADMQLMKCKRLMVTVMLLLCIWQFHLLSGVLPHQQGTAYMNVEWADDSLLRDLHAHVQLLQHVWWNAFLLVPGQATKKRSLPSALPQRDSVRWKPKLLSTSSLWKTPHCIRLQQNLLSENTLCSLLKDHLFVVCFVTFPTSTHAEALPELVNFCTCRFFLINKHSSVPCHLGSCTPASRGTLHMFYIE